MNLTVAICTRNRPQSLNRVLSCLLKSTPPHELIIINDISEIKNHSKPKILNKFSKSTKITYKKVRFKQITKSRNLCLKICQTKYIIFMDDDISFNQDITKNIINLHRQYPQAVGFVGKISHDSHQPLLDSFNDYWFNQGYFNTTTCQKRPIATSALISLNIILLRKYKLFFKPIVYSSSEDTDLCCRLYQKSLFLYHSPKIKVIHNFGNRNIFYFFKRFYEYGIAVSDVLYKYPHILKNYSSIYILPSRKLHYLFLPIFFLKVVYLKTKEFIIDNQITKKDLRYFSYIVHYFYILGIYNSPITKKLLFIKFFNKNKL